MKRVTLSLVSVLILYSVQHAHGCSPCLACLQYICEYICVSSWGSALVSIHVRVHMRVRVSRGQNHALFLRSHPPWILKQFLTGAWDLLIRLI